MIALFPFDNVPHTPRQPNPFFKKIKRTPDLPDNLHPDNQSTEKLLYP
jgi:hypothetical protein